MVKVRKIIVKKQFDEGGRNIVKYIRLNSEQNAEKFKTEVDKITNKIALNPTVYPEEKYLQTNNKHYRFAIVMKSWKIIFKITDELIVFIAVIYAARSPKKITNLRTNKYD